MHPLRRRKTPQNPFCPDPERPFLYQAEAQLLDTLLALHADHGGGNNSTFACRVATSSGTDPFAAYTSAINSLKGPRHGGANIKVIQMLDDIKAHVAHWRTGAKWQTTSPKFSGRKPTTAPV
ncbi:MAG: citrate/2-methylcitrate synthase [Ruminococcus callidus]